MPTIAAQDIVNAVIQDSQGLTTNRTALYDYTDRICQRILRESQWRFLLSDPVSFTTIPGVSSYTLTSGPAPAGAFLTNLGLTNFASIAPGSMYNMSTGTKLEEDSDSETTLSSMVNRDGSLRQGPPRTYSNSITNPGTITIKPAPDSNNVYYPIPETPYATFATAAGCTLPARTYYGVVTFVDSLGGESTGCRVPISVSVPASEVVTISSPLAPPGGTNATQVSYNAWNLYLGYSNGNYLIQNTNPIPIGTSWTESIAGIFTGLYPIPSITNVPVNSYLTISPTGILASTASLGLTPPKPYALIDANGIWWELLVIGGILQAATVVPSSSLLGVSAIFLNDTSGISTWKITITTAGVLVTSKYSTPVTLQALFGTPPTASTIHPLNAYVIQFRFYQSRNQITSSAPTQVLQIPYAYKDVVIAGVNYLTSLYIDRQDNRAPSARTLAWKQEYDQGIKEIRRDLRINFRKTDYISPDTVSQYVMANQQGIPTMGW